MAREFEDEHGGLVLIALGARTGTAARGRRLFEAAVSIVAALLHLTVRRGRDALLVLPGSDPVRVPAGDRVALEAAERRLARLQEDPGWPDWGAVPDAAAGCAWVLVHPGNGEPPVVPAGADVVNAAEAIAREWFRPRGGAPS
jgi:uncharacterized protein (DUF58 family)